MDVFRQRKRNERETEKRVERRRRRGSTDKSMEFKRSKKESNIIECSAHKSNSKIEVTFGFYIFSRLKCVTCNICNAHRNILILLLNICNFSL